MHEVMTKRHTEQGDRPGACLEAEKQVKSLALRQGGAPIKRVFFPTFLGSHRLSGNSSGCARLQRVG